MASSICRKLAVKVSRNQKSAILFYFSITWSIICLTENFSKSILFVGNCFLNLGIFHACTSRAVHWNLEHPCLSKLIVRLCWLVLDVLEKKNIHNQKNVHQPFKKSRFFIYRKFYWTTFSQSVLHVYGGFLSVACMQKTKISHHPKFWDKNKILMLFFNFYKTLIWQFCFAKFYSF